MFVCLARYSFLRLSLSFFKRFLPTAVHCSSLATTDITENDDLNAENNTDRTASLFAYFRLRIKPNLFTDRSFTLLASLI